MRFIVAFALAVLTSISAFAVNPVAAPPKLIVATPLMVETAFTTAQVEPKFRQFAAVHHIRENVDFLIAARNYFEETKANDRVAAAGYLYRMYIAIPQDRSRIPINISQQVRARIDLAIKTGTNSKSIFVDAYKEILGLLVQNLNLNFRVQWDAFARSNRLDR